MGLATALLPDRSIVTSESSMQVAWETNEYGLRRYDPVLMAKPFLNWKTFDLQLDSPGER